MGKAPNTDSSQGFLRTTFQEYYNQLSLNLPDRFTRREFAFVLFGGKGMLRHLSFQKKKDVEQFFDERVPQHAYYSSAYYQHPDAPTMDEKTWMGAELIFDLDSDHLPNAHTLSYSEQLALVKEEFIKLVEEFLLGDFGFNERYLELYFSGGRGYHCHVKDPAIFDLDSNERREVVDYITGRDLRDAIIFREHATGRRQYGRRSYASGKSLTMPTPDQKGWKGRISRELIRIVNEIKQSDDPEAKLQEYGVKKKDAERLVSELSDERLKRIQDGLLDQSRVIRKFFLNRALRKSAVSLSAGETDEPVTCDVKRLIRLPSSLHGKTGFQVVHINVSELESFDPLTDAVVLPDEPVTVTMSKPLTITMKGEEFTLSQGGQDLPTYLAVFCIGRKLATLA